MLIGLICVIKAGLLRFIRGFCELRGFSKENKGFWGISIGISWFVRGFSAFLFREAIFSVINLNNSLFL